MIFGQALAAAVISTSLSPSLPVSYRMEARLDTSTHKIYAAEQVIFLNPTPDTLDKVCFHLYPNAFRDTTSLYARTDSHTRQRILAGDKSVLIISNVTIDGAVIESSAITETGTLLYIALPRRLPPGDSIAIGLDFELLIPRKQVRIGYNERGNYLVSHWHPILCGYQNGRRVDFEYHPQSEFFSNFSNYDVRLEVPPDFAMGTTGEMTMVEKDSSRAIWRAVADTVLDFAFVCGPAFELFESDTLGIRLRYLIDKDNEDYFSITDAATKYSIAFCSNRLFSYPYKTFTLVDYDIEAQGMELPGMNIISFPKTNMKSAGRPVLWFVIAHEVAHEWFYGTVASNEAEEPWLDEGFSTYMAARIMEMQDDSLKSFSFLGYRIPINTLDKLFALMSKADWPVNLKSWYYPDDFSYAAAVYFRASAMIQTLEQLAGRAAFDSALNAYAIEYRFKHPSAEDLQNSLESSLGIDLSSFFAQFIGGTARVDYEVRSLEYKAIGGSENNQSGYNIKVIVGREFEGVLPQRLKVGLHDGTAIDTTWDGNARTAIIEFTAGARPDYAQIGYGHGPYALDENLANNSMYIKSLGSRLLTFEWDGVFIMELLLSLFL
jgi:hypothetical protein